MSAISLWVLLHPCNHVHLKSTYVRWRFFFDRKLTCLRPFFWHLCQWFPPLNFSSVDGAAELWVSNATEVNYTTWQPPCWDFDWRDDSYIRLKCLDTVVFPDAITQGDTFSRLNPPLVWSGELPYEGLTLTQRNYGALENMTLYAAHTSPQKTIEKLCKVCRFI